MSCVSEQNSQPYKAGQGPCERKEEERNGWCTDLYLDRSVVIIGQWIVDSEVRMDSG